MQRQSEDEGVERWGGGGEVEAEHGMANPEIWKYSPNKRTRLKGELFKGRQGRNAMSISMA